MAEQLHHSLVPLEGGINFRDLGGNKGIDGRKIRYGLLFRSGSLHRLTDGDRHYLSQLPVTQILDYRDSHEISHQPDRLWKGAIYTHQSANNANRNLMGITPTEISNASFSQFDAPQIMLALYRALPFNNPAYRQLVQLLLNGKPAGLVQHCAIGKDRTGVGVALLLLALGADRETVVQDYLLTQVTLEPFRQKICHQFAPQLNGQNRDKLYYVMSAREEFMMAALNSIIERYGSFAEWLQQEYGLDQQKLRLLQGYYLQE